MEYLCCRCTTRCIFYFALCKIYFLGALILCGLTTIKRGVLEVAGGFGKHSASMPGVDKTPLSPRKRFAKYGEAPAESLNFGSDQGLSIYLC